MSKAGEWVLQNQRQVIFGVIIFLVYFLSFGLGYLVNRELNHPPIVIEKCSLPTEAEGKLEIN
jgi:hypothetical protein